MALPMRAAQGFILCDACDHLFTEIFRVLFNSKMKLYGFFILILIIYMAIRGNNIIL